MKNSQLAWLLGGALVLSSGGLGIAACSSTSGSGNPSGGDSGSGGDGSGGNDTGTGNDTGNGGNDTGTGGDGGAGGDCGSTPSLHPGTGTSVYCPFGPDGGGALKCTGATPQCCIGGKTGTNQYAASECVAFGSACPNPADGGEPFECGEAVDCTANNHGTICCGGGPLPAIDPACSFYREKGIKSSTCEQGTACAAGEFQLCATNAECGAGKTCTPFKAKGMQLGFCM